MKERFKTWLLRWLGVDQYMQHYAKQEARTAICWCLTEVLKEDKHFQCTVDRNIDQAVERIHNGKLDKAVRERVDGIIKREEILDDLVVRFQKKQLN